MLAIKLQRIGKKHQPFYRLVVAEKKSKMIAPPVEDLGSYNPATKKTTLNSERVKYWLGVGARPTATSHNLLVTAGVIEGKKIAVKMKVAVKADVPTVASETPVAETPVEEAAKTEEKPVEAAA
ncbi:MAG: small subunit ribosomal protein S16 [Parcubacteria group bacterium Gr01-1014_20]|nr:MAG: small subunit ribosomal protein S16 [Parcubacteria group bacterium Gr01-1014_20]